MNMFWGKVGTYLGAHVGQLAQIGWGTLKILLLIILAQILLRIVNRVMQRMLHLRAKIDERRRMTLESLFRNISRYTIYFILLLTVLPIVGVHIAALLAGAGVAGIAIAFGAQALLTDFFSGLFILFEDQYGVGDWVMADSVVGQVRMVGLRTTVLKVWTGELVTIRNGQISQVTNYSKENSVGVVDINVGFQTPVTEATEIIESVLAKLFKDETDIVGDPAMLGVQAINNSTYTLRSTIECKPYTQYGMIRKAKQKVHQAFVEQGIDLPVQKVVYMPGPSAVGMGPLRGEGTDPNPTP